MLSHGAVLFVIGSGSFQSSQLPFFLLRRKSFLPGKADQSDLSCYNSPMFDKTSSFTPLT